MGMIIGPTPWWQANLVASLPVGGTLPDGSRIYCKAGGTAWIVAPSSTEVCTSWTSGKYNGVDAPGTEVCCICEWSGLQSCLISRGFNPCDWFVPSYPQLQSACNCKSFWDSVSSFDIYWSSSESTINNAFYVRVFTSGSGTDSKTQTFAVRAIRCVTY